MADGYKLWQKCPYCVDGKQKKSVNEQDIADVDCPQCGATGWKFFGWCSTDTYTLPDDVPSE